MFKVILVLAFYASIAVCIIFNNRGIGSLETRRAYENEYMNFFPFFIRYFFVVFFLLELGGWWGWLKRVGAGRVGVGEWIG